MTRISRATILTTHEAFATVQKANLVQEKVKKVSESIFPTLAKLEFGKKIAFIAAIISYLAGFPLVSLICLACFGILWDDTEFYKEKERIAISNAQKELACLLDHLAHVHAKQVEKMSSQITRLELSIKSLTKTDRQIKKSSETLSCLTRKISKKHEELSEITSSLEAKGKKLQEETQKLSELREAFETVKEEMHREVQRLSAEITRLQSS